MNNHKVNRFTHEGIDELTTEMIAPAGAPRTSRTQGTEHVHTDMTALLQASTPFHARVHINTCMHARVCQTAAMGTCTHPRGVALVHFRFLVLRGRSPCRASSRRQLHISHMRILTRAQKTAPQHRSTVARVSRYRLQHACGRDGVGVRANVSASCFSL